MAEIKSKIDTSSDKFLSNFSHHKTLDIELDKLIISVQKMGSVEKIEKHKKRGKLTARKRIDLLKDPETKLLEFSQLAAYKVYEEEVPAAGIITGIINVHGRQCIVVAVDVKRNYNVAGQKNVFTDNDKKFWFEVFIYGGKKETGIDAIEWTKKMESLGAGEILLTSIDMDGTKDGYDIDLTREIVNSVSIPVIASGGCGKPEDMIAVFKKTDVEAALAASIFHYETHSVDRVKKLIKENGIPVRI